MSNYSELRTDGGEDGLWRFSPTQLEIIDRVLTWSLIIGLFVLAWWVV